MTETLWLLAKTVAYRPYVFAFLAGHLVAAGIALGPLRAGLLTVVVWATAFVAEYSSTRTGIPFGFYVYLGNTRDRELYLSNVPFMDSLSFSFLAFAAYATALALLAPLNSPPGARLPRPVVSPRLAGSPATLALAAVLFTLLDVVIDPVALRGERWFLGRIYTYPEPGVYFGVPLANFAGWLVVGAVGLGLYRAADAALTRRGASRPVRGEGLLLGLALYYAVLAFNLAVTFAIGERLLGAVGCLLHLLPALLLARRLRRPGDGAGAPPVFCPRTFCYNRRRSTRGLPRPRTAAFRAPATGSSGDRRPRAP